MAALCRTTISRRSRRFILCCAFVVDSEGMTICTTDRHGLLACSRAMYGRNADASLKCHMMLFVLGTCNLFTRGSLRTRGVPSVSALLPAAWPPAEACWRGTVPYRDLCPFLPSLPRR